MPLTPNLTRETLPLTQTPTLATQPLTQNETLPEETAPTFDINNEPETVAMNVLCSVCETRVQPPPAVKRKKERRVK